MLSSAYRFGKMRCDFCVGEEFNFFPIILLNRVRFFFNKLTDVLL